MARTGRNTHHGEVYGDFGLVLLKVFEAFASLFVFDHDHSSSRGGLGRSGRRFRFYSPLYLTEMVVNTLISWIGSIS